MPKTLDLRKKTTEPEKDISSPEVAGRPMSIPRVAWFGPLSYHNPDTRFVWMVSGFIFAIAALLQIFEKNLITTVFFVLLGVMILIQAKRKQRVGEVEITTSGVKIDQQTYHYRELKSFWIDYRPDEDTRELSLQSKKWYLPYLRVPMEEQNPVQIRAILLKFLPEIEHEETLSDVIAKRLGL